MKVHLIAYGIAKDILGNTSMDYDVQDKCTTGQLKAALSEDFPEFSKLASLRLAVDIDYVGDSYVLRDEDEVVIIPPVSGG